MTRDAAWLVRYSFVMMLLVLAGCRCTMACLWDSGPSRSHAYPAILPVQHLLKAARMVEARVIADAIDINFGCPQVSASASHQWTADSQNSPYGAGRY